MYLLPLAARAHRAADLVHTLAHAQLLLYQIPENRLWLHNIVLLESQPQRRHPLWAHILRSRDHHLNSICSEAIVGEVYLLDSRHLTAEVREPLCSAVVQIVLVKLKHPKLRTTTTHLQNHPQAD